MGRPIRSLLQSDLRPGRAWMREARRANNPLLRQAGRVERAVAAVCLAVLVAAVVGVGALSAHAYAVGVANERQQAARRSTTVATVESDPSVPPIGSDWSVPALASVTYRWHGTVRHGVAPVADSVRPGDRLPVWLDSAGLLAQQPRPHSQTMLDAMAVGGLGGGVLLIAGSFGWVGYRTWSLRRRGALWDEEWLQFVAGQQGLGR
jgi:hypothetical protein